MDPQKINALLAVLLSFIPFALVAGWLFYRRQNLALLCLNREGLLQKDQGRG